MSSRDHHTGVADCLFILGAKVKMLSKTLTTAILEGRDATDWRGPT